MEMRNLHQKQGLKGVDVVARYKSYCPRSVYRHMKMKITDSTGDKRKFNGAKKLEIPKIAPKKIKRKNYKPIPLTLSVNLRILHQDFCVRGKELVRRYPHYSAANIYKHMIKPVDRDPTDNRKNNPGRPPILTDRDRRRILLQIPKLRKKNEGDFTVSDII